MSHTEQADGEVGADALKSVMEKLAAAAPGTPPGTFDHAAFTVLSEAGVGAKATFAALDRLRESFVDWNDLRFARVAELADVLADFPAPEHTARLLRNAYRHQFDESGRMDLHFPDDARAADVKKRLAKLFPCLGKTPAAYLLYEHLPGQPLPLSDGALAAARKHGLLPKNGQRAQLQKRLEDALTPGEIVRLVELLEMASANGHPYGEAWPTPPDPEELRKKAKKKR